MQKLNRNLRYKIIEVYSNSGMYSLRDGLEGSNFSLSHTQRPQYSIEEPPELCHAQIKLESGTMRGMSLFLTFFTAKLIHAKDSILCTCKAYPFPHHTGERKCNCISESTEKSNE